MTPSFFGNTCQELIYLSGLLMWVDAVYGLKIDLERSDIIPMWGEVGGKLQ